MISILAVKTVMQEQAKGLAKKLGLKFEDYQILQ